MTPTAALSWRRLVSCQSSAGRYRLHQVVFLVGIFDGVFQLLPVEERPVATTRCQQFFVSPLLDNLSILEHDNPARVANRADAMRRDERRASRQCRPKRMKNLRFGVGVNSR